jgi:ribosomal protein S27AE
MKCGDCGQDILQQHPQMCPYCRSKNLIAEEDETKVIAEIERLAKAGHCEEAALRFEKLDQWDKARECRRMDKKRLLDAPDMPTGKVGTINVVCPHCGESQPLRAGLDKESCRHCGIVYKVPEKLREITDLQGNS